MTTSVLEPQATGADAVDQPGLPEPAERGGLRIADRVVAKIAATAAAEVDGTGSVPRRLLGQSLGGPSENKAPHVTVKVDGMVAVISVAVSVRYPRSIRDVAAAVTTRIRDRVQALTGMDTARIDVEVPVLLTEQRDRPRVM